MDDMRTPPNQVYVLRGYIAVYPGFDGFFAELRDICAKTVSRFSGLLGVQDSHSIQPMWQLFQRHLQVTKAMLLQHDAQNQLNP